MAQNNWLDEGSTPVPQPTSAAADTSWLDEQSDISQDNALVRGFKKSSQSIGITKGLVTGDSADTARKVAEAADYARKNPGTKEGAELMDAWNRGDGVTGGVTEVAGEFAKDWRNAKGFIPGVRATAKNLQAMGSGIIEQVPNMIAPVAGMIAGGAAGSAAAGPVGTVLGGWAGASLGNTAVEGGSMVQEALQKDKIDPADQAAVSAYLDKNGDRILGQAGVKGAIIGAVDTATAGLGHFLLSGPGKAAASRALADMGVDAADKAAVRAAQSSAAFKNRIASDAAYQATQQGANKIARNAGAAALEPAGEFAGEFVGQGVATGEWDTKNAALEAASSIGQSGAMYAGQKAIQAFSRPGAATNDPSEQPVPAPGQPPAADTPPADVPPGDGQAGPGGGLGAPTGAGADMAGMLAPANPLLEAMNQRAADPSAIAPPIDDGKIFDKSAAAPVAGELYQPGDTTNPLTGERITAKPSEAMGINPADGPLSTGAALAVDTGVSEQMQQAAALAEAVKAAPKTPAGEAKTAAPDLSGWSDQQLSDTFRAAQAPDVRRQLAVELSRRRDVREQQALRQEMDAEQAAMDMQDAPDDAFANVREDAGAPNLQDGPSHSVADGVADKGRQPTVSQQPKEASSGTQAQETQQAGQGQQEARAAQAGARDESHLNALELRLSHERGRLRAAKTDAERATRQVTVDGIEREIAGERKFLGLAPQAASAMSDDALMQALKPDGAEKTSTAQPPLSGTISPQPQAAGPALAAPEFTTIKTVHGDSVTVRTSDLQGDAPRLRQYTKAGKAKAVPAIHRDNLDLTGEKSAERAKENAKNPLFHTVTTKDGGAFASQAAAQREVNRLGLQDSHEVVEAGGGFVGRIKKTGEQHGATARNLRLADERTPGAGAAAPHGPGESVAGEAPVVGAGQRQQAQAATENVAPDAEQSPVTAINKKQSEAEKALLRLAGLKGSKLISDDGRGRKLFEVKVTPEFRNRHFVNGLMPMVDGLELKEKSAVTGNVYDDGYILIDNREQLASRRAAAPNSGVEAQAQETTYNGTRIYPTKIKMGDEVKSMWAVESPDNQRRRAAGERTIGGDSLHDTIEQAKAAAEREAKRDAEQQAAKAEQDAADKARRDAEEARKAANRPKSVVERRKDAILDGPSKIGQGTKRAVITTAVDNGYVIEAKMVYDHAAKKRDQEAVDRASRAGYILGVSNENLPLVKAGNEAKARLKEGKYEKPEYRVYQGSDTKAPFREITKTEYDYAQELKAQRAAAPQAEAAQPATPQQDGNDFLPEGWTKSVNGFTKRPVYRMEQGVGQPFAVVTQTDGMTYEVQIRHGDKQLTVGTQRGALSEVLAAAKAELGRMKRADSVTHADPGEKAEAATPAVVTDSLKKAASNEDTKPSEMRKWLVAEIDKELLQAPDRADYDEAVKRLGEKDAISMFTGNGPLGKNSETGFITFDVPGDGKYKVRNSVRGLLEFRKNVMASSGFKDSGQKQVKPEQNRGVQGGSGGSMAAITNMIEEGDFEAARDYAEAVGVKLEDVKVPRGDMKPAWEKYLKDGTLPPAPDTRQKPAPKTAAQLDEEKRQAAEAEAKKPKDTGWNMAGTGYGGKRYIGRNITLDDGREVVARVYENAGTYEEAEVKVDGVRKFTVTDRDNAQGKADAFIRTLQDGDQAAGSAKSPTRVTPQISGNPEKFIKVAADSVRELRSVDVDRVLTETPVQFRAEVAGYIRDQRKDLADEVDDVMADIQPMAAAPAPAPATTGARRDPAKVSMFNPYEDGDIVTINGQDWTVKQDTPGWYLTTTGNWRGQHPTIRNIKAMADLIREVEQAATASPAAQPEAPKLTPAEAKSLMEWQDLGQKDGVKTHALTFYESQADKDAKRGRMIVAKVTKGDRSASNWMVDGDDKPLAVLGMAKKRAEEIGMAKLVADGFVAQEGNTAPEGTQFPMQEAVSSYAGISHRGQERAQSDADEFERFISAQQEAGLAVAETEDQKAAVARAVEALRADYVTAYRRLMGVRANTYSAYVAGRSGLNSRQANRSNSALDKAMEAFSEWQTAASGRVRRAALDARTDDQKQADQQAREQTEADKAQRREDADRSLIRKILTWKKGGEAVPIGKSATLSGVNLGRDGYPTSVNLKPNDGATLTSDKFDLAALFRRDGMSVPDSRRRVRELVDAVRAEDAAQTSGQDAAPASAPTSDSKTPMMDGHVDLLDRVREGKATADQIRESFARMDAGRDALEAELNTMSKDKLLRSGGYSFAMRHRDSKKAEVVSAMVDEVLDEYSLGRSYGPTGYVLSAGAFERHKQARAADLRELVAGLTDEDIAQFARQVAESRAELQARREATQQALENPQTLADFRAVISSHMEKHGDSMRDAYLRLTPEQRARYDDLEAEGTKARREQAKATAKTAVAAAGQAVAGEVIATKHTKLGHDLFVVQLAERVSREDYETLNASAKRMGGSYSSYRGNGAIPGFQFRTREAAEAFSKLVAGDEADAQAVAQARRDAFEDDRSQSAVERLRAMAAALNERADEQLGRERKTNTARRARFAASAEGAALADKALAGTMNNLAAAIEAGTTKFLDAVRQKVQVEMLGQYLRSAKDAQIRAKYPSYGDQQKHRGEPVDAETVDYAEFPTYVAMRSDLASIARQMLEVDGLKQLGQRLMSVADDVSEAYTAWAKDNLLSVSRFGRGDQLADFVSRDGAERAMRRAGLADRAIVLPIKRGQNRVVLAPSEAMKLGLWQGDGDKRITLSSDFGRELVQAVGRRAGGQIKLPWTLEAALERRKRLEGMGIFTAPEFRSALREFAGLQQAIATPDKIKEMERAMIGRANDGLDFFPTSPDVVQSMLDAAEIQDGMAVLEPSAGMGHIADAIRKTAGVDPDVVELSGARRELLEAKGYNLVGNDFMAMTPRSGFTFGDVFRDANGDLGVMRGSGSMGSGRVGFQPLDASRQPDARNARWVNRDELTGVEHRGADSGYDRIIMNPPFSDGRDIQHVQHAYELLRPGGRIVALMGDGAFFQSNRRAEAFRAWLDERGATSERLPEGSFMDPSLPVNTSVNARMVVIDKPAAAQDGDANFGARQRAASGTPTDRVVMDMLREGRSAKDVLGMIAGTSRSRFNRQVARLLLRTGVTPKVEALAADGLGKDKRGFNLLAKYNRDSNTISLTEGAGYMAEQIMLHELIHAATLRALDRKGLASLQMRRLFEHVQKHGGLAGTYGMKNVGEFTSEAFTNPEFQRALRQIAAPPGGRIKAAWDGFVRILRSILGLPQSEHSALSRALELGVAVMREDMALRQRGVVARGRDAQAGIDQTHMDATNENAPTSDKSGAFAGLPQSGMQERAVRAVTGSPEPAQSGFEAGSGAKITTVPAGVVKSALERANKEAASLAEFDIQEELRSLQENGGGADLAEIAQNPEFWDAEDEVFTQAGLDEIDRINEQIARDRAGVSVAESLEDLNSAHHFAQALAFESILDGLGVPYEKDGRQSQYFTIYDQNTGDNIIKFRFADHENTVRDSALGQHRILFNVAPGGRSFTDAVQRLIQVLNDQSAPETDGAFMGVNQTETPAFRRWFGDSKVVDADGKPLVVYHATDAKFSVFDFDKLGSVTDSNTGGDQTAIATSRIGFWFHERPLTAAHEMGSSVAMDVYLSLENPARLTQRDLWRVAENFNNDADAIRDYFTEGEFDGEDRDGLIIEDEEFGGTSFVAFYPEQIKSAIGNNGNFDPADGRIDHFGANRPAKDGTPTDRAVMDMTRDGKSAQDILRLIAGTSKSRFNRQVARLLLKTGITPEVVFADTDLGGGDGFKFKAKYSRAQDRVTLTGEAAGQAEQIVLHELIHAATLKALDKPGLHSLQMRRLFEHVKRQGGAAGQYGMKNVGEFVAEVFTNPEFQRLLRQMDAPAGGTLKSAWEGFVRILRSILGLPQSEHSALSRALELGVAVMREDMQLRQRGALRAGMGAQRAVGDAPPAEAMRVQQAIEGKSLLDAARFLTQSSNPAYAEIAGKVLEKLQAMQRAGVNLSLHVVHVGDSAPQAMAYSRAYTEMALDAKGRDVAVWVNGADVTGKVGTEEEALLHELVHAATAGALLHGSKVAASPHARAAKAVYEAAGAISEHISRRFEQAEQGKATLTAFEQDMRDGHNNAFRDMDEVVAWALTNREAQQYLDGIPYQGGQTLWTRFVQAVRSFLGLEAKADSVLSEVLAAAEQLMDATDTTLPAVKAFWHKRGLPMITQQAASSYVTRQPAADQTQTEAFKRWFGDSKVVDAEGKPLRVFHGTTSDIRAFAGKVGADGNGAFFFTESPEAASAYAKKDRARLDEVYRLEEQASEVRRQIDILEDAGRSYPDPEIVALEREWDSLSRKASELEAAPEGAGSNVIPAYLSIQNPLVIDMGRSGKGQFDMASVEKIGNSIEQAKAEGRDGVIVRNTHDSPEAGEAHDIFVAFRPEQVKSAIGNNGNFDPEDADIAHFGAAELRGLKDNALDRINTVMSHPGTVSLWDKTVGTMRHLAQRAPAFKPVFEAAQRFIDDVAMMANDAADMAPRVLPRVDTWRDLAKKPISAADNKAVAKPLFEGTLLWARDANDKPVLVSDLEKRYASLPAEDKAQMMLKLGKLDAGVLKMWQGLPLDQFEKLVNSRFDGQMLKAGVVWTDKELADIFKATPHQISLYRETRKAIDRSIDMTARADMLRVLGEDFGGLRDAVLEQDSLGDAMEFLISELTERQRANPDDSRRLTELHNSIVDRAEKARDLMAKGYAPLSRFGRYTVDVVDARGERQYFGMYESKADSNRALLQLKAAFPDATVTQGTMSQEAYKLFAGITPESLELFGNMLGLDEEGGDARDKVFQEYLKLTKNNHSALKRLIHRQGIAGFSEDVGRVLASFVYSNARQAAGALNAGTIDRAVNAIPKEQGELKDVAMGLRNYIRDPQEEGQAVRGMLFAQYLGGSVASAFVNMTQPFAVTMPWLSQYGGIKSAGAHLAKALKDMGTKGFKYEADLAAALKHAEDDGVVSPQEIHQLMAQARGSGSLRSGDGTKVGEARAAAANAWERTKVAWGQPFALAEQFNRRSTFIAAYRIAKEQKMADPAAFARRAVEETQFVYSKAAKSRWMRGAIGGTLMTFKSYSIQYLELLHRMWTQGGPEGKRAVGWAMVMLMLAGGAGGLPFMEDLEDLIDGIAQLMGYNVSSKQWRQRALRDVLGKELAEFMEQGVSGLPGAPVDVSGRLGLGNLIPGTGLLLQKPNRERDLLEVAGPAGDLFKRGFTGGRKLLAGDVGGAALEVSPTAVRNAVKGADMAASGMYKDAKGYKVIDTTLGEALAKAGGFQPRSVAQVQEANSFMMRSRSFYQQNSAEIKAQWADALFRKDEAALERVRERLAAWNRDNPEQPIVVKMPDVWKRVREMGKDRTQRIADTAPKALRQQMREMARENG